MKVRYTLPALADLTSILDYIAAHSPPGAKRVQARIQAIVNLLPTHPYIGVRTADPVIRRLNTSPPECLARSRYIAQRLRFRRHCAWKVAPCGAGKSR